jgi:ureidoglycolate dehydrogenase (NAD+)
MLIRYEDLVVLTRSILAEAGLDEESTAAVSTGLCETSLRGVDTHGIRLLPHYVTSAENGRKNPRPKYKYTKTFPALGQLDADDAFGHAAGMKAIEYALEMAETQGIGAVAVFNSSHCGSLASMALKAARRGYLAFAFTHADSLLLSDGGRRAYFGTNPLCFAAPRREEEPYCLDMSCSLIPWNRVAVHRVDGRPLPQDTAVDSEGNVVTDPNEAKWLLPAGGYKGYGLASMVEVLCGIYTNMPFGLGIPAMFAAPLDEPRKLGQFYMVMRSDGVATSSTFVDRMQMMTDEVRAEPSVSDQGVMLPGDPQIREMARRQERGIPCDAHTTGALRALARKYGVSDSCLEG